MKGNMACNSPGRICLQIRFLLKSNLLSQTPNMRTKNSIFKIIGEMPVGEKSTHENSLMGQDGNKVVVIRGDQNDIGNRVVGTHCMLFTMIKPRRKKKG